MSFFGRMLASVGIGSAKVDTVLEKVTYMPGEVVRGAVRIQGGSVEQQMDGIELAVMTTYLHEQNDVKTYKNVEVHRVQVSQPQMIGAQEYKEVPFSFSLPGITPLTIGRGSVWIKTRVDIQSALDPTDEDRIQIIPSPAQRVVLEAVESIGFRLRETESVYAPRLRGPLPFVQEFEFVPVGGRYRGKLDELEVTFLNVRPEGIELLLQIDRKARGFLGHFAESLNVDESLVRVTLGLDDLNAGVSRVAGTLDSIVAKYA